MAISYCETSALAGWPVRLASVSVRVMVYVDPDWDTPAIGVPLEPKLGYGSSRKSPAWGTRYSGAVAGGKSIWIWLLERGVNAVEPAALTLIL